jgi:hypothetical protein
VTWKPETIHVAVRRHGQDSVRTYEGYTYRGLGLFVEKHEEVPMWSLTHLNSGHAIHWMKGRLRNVFPAAAEYAELTDWTLFTLINGWQQTDPDLKTKVRALRDKHGAMIFCGGGHGVGNDDAARLVARSREQ